MWQNLPPLLATPGEFSVTYILRDLYPGCHPSNLIRIQMPSRGISRFRDSERLRTFTNVLEIDADGNHLPLDIFTNFPSLETLTLCANNIDCLRKDEYHFPYLRNLDLSFNRLQPHDLPKLGQLKALRELTLSRNRLRFITNDFSAKGNFPSLQILRLDQNCLRFQNTFYILSKLPRLTTLILDNNHFQEIPYLVYMGEKHEYEVMISNGLRLLQSYGNFLQKHHHQHINRKLYQHETKVSPCSFTTLNTTVLQNAKTRWTNKNRQPRTKFNKIITKKFSKKDINIKNEKINMENDKKDDSELNSKHQSKDDIIESTTPLDDNLQIFNELMEDKWEGLKDDKNENIHSKNDEDDNENLDRGDKDCKLILSMSSKDSKENILNKKLEDDGKMKNETDTTFEDDKVDRSVYELYHVPFPCLERLALRRCEITRQVTVLSCVLWPSLSHIDFTGNRLFDNNSHPGNVRAIVKFFSKAGVNIQTGYQFHCLLKSDLQIINNSINSSSVPTTEKPNNFYNYVLNQQPDNVQAYWKQVIENHGRNIMPQKKKSDDNLSKIINGKIELHLGESPPEVNLKSAISRNRLRKHIKSKSDIHSQYKKGLSFIDQLRETESYKSDVRVRHAK